MKSFTSARLLPALVIVSLVAAFILVTTAVFYVQASITMSSLEFTIDAGLKDNGIEYKLLVKNAGILDISLRLFRVRVNDENNRYIWFDNWNFQDDTNIVAAKSEKTFTVQMSIPPDKLERAVEAKRPVLDFSGLYNLPKVGNVSFNNIQAVSIVE